MTINGADETLATAELYLTMFELYKTTVEKMWGAQYLNEEFFLLLHKVGLLPALSIHVPLFTLVSKVFRRVSS